MKIETLNFLEDARCDLRIDNFGVNYKLYISSEECYDSQYKYNLLIHFYFDLNKQIVAHDGDRPARFSKIIFDEIISYLQTSNPQIIKDSLGRTGFNFWELTQ